MKETLTQRSARSVIVPGRKVVRLVGEIIETVIITAAPETC